jgi:hypothetical protein
MQYVLRHLLWKHRTNQDYLGEWKGLVPPPEISPRLIGDARKVALNDWLDWVIRNFDACLLIDEDWDLDKWNACPNGMAVCLDVTDFNWPIGDHIWHTWNDTSHALDWPQMHYFFEVKELDKDHLQIVSKQETHRPLRDAVEGQQCFHISDTPLEPFRHQLAGTFVRKNGVWQLDPHFKKDLLPASERYLLEKAQTEFFDSHEL